MEKTIDIKELYEKLKMIERVMVTKAELDKVIETIAVLSNWETMAQIEESEKDIKEGRVRNIHSVADL